MNAEFQVKTTYCNISRMLWGAIALCVLFLSAAGCDTGAEQPRAQYPGVLYAVVGEEKVTLTSALPGRVAPLVVSEVRPQVDGIILERLFEEGADVEAGQVLYQIDPALYQAAYNTAGAVLEEAEANVAALALLEKRYRNLVKTNAVSRQDLDNAISEHAQARARIARARAELEAAAINLAYTRIKAPVSGRIGVSSVTPGALVTANQARTLAVIQQTERVYVDFRLPSANVIRLRRAMAQGTMTPNGSAAKVRLKLEDGSSYTPVAHDSEKSGERQWILGDLLFSDISVGQTTGSVAMRAIFPNRDGLLLPGMYVTAIIEEGAVEHAILIPQGSVLAADSGGHIAFVLHEDASGENLFRVEHREVVLDRAYGNRWIVKDGLLPGDRLIVEGLQAAVSAEAVRAAPARGASETAVASGATDDGGMR